MLKGNFCVGDVGETIGDSEDDEVKEEPLSSSVNTFTFCRHDDFPPLHRHPPRDR